jgi:hypothetical protein
MDVSPTNPHDWSEEESLDPLLFTPALQQLSCFCVLNNRIGEEASESFSKNVVEGLSVVFLVKLHRSSMKD